MLPLKGKILNVERARFDKMLASVEVATLITALGTGVGKTDFNISKLRYHRVILMTDADVDGSHIRTLLLTFFFRQMPELITRGHIYIAQPPLYKVKQGKSERYIKDEGELQNHLLESALDGTALRTAATTIQGKELASLCQNHLGVEQTITRLARRYDRSKRLLHKLIYLPPLTQALLRNQKQYEAFAAELQGRLATNQNGAHAIKSVSVAKRTTCHELVVTRSEHGGSERERIDCRFVRLLEYQRAAPLRGNMTLAALQAAAPVIQRSD